jgi:succinate dehydrogenase / fumarate reductase, membrane anchor subunit
VLETFANPVAAIVTALILVVGMRHFAMGATMMIEDYAQGTTRKALVIGAVSLAWVIAATGLFALARIAL